MNKTIVFLNTYKINNYTCTAKHAKRKLVEETDGDSDDFEMSIIFVCKITL